MNKKLWKSLAVCLVLMFVAISIADLFAPKDQYTELDYNQFLSYVESSRIADATITDQKSQISTVTGTLKDGTKFFTAIPVDPDLYQKMVESGVVVELKLPQEPSWWLTLIANLLPALLMVGLFVFMMQQTQGGGKQVMQFGKARARLQSEAHEKVTFDDVAGCDEAKEELGEIVDFLKHPKKYLEMGARIPKGVLLFGAPGTGKTYIARAVAGEAGVPFLSISGSDFVEMFVGVGAARVRDLFNEAKKRSPAIVFIDEIDAVGRMRGAGMGGGHDEREQTLNQLLVEMDGFSVNEGIIVMAATNRPDVLDPALLRPGRFDRQIVLDKPDLNARVEILKLHTRSKPLSKEVDLEVLARATPGFTPADLENVVNEAALLAARSKKRRIGMQELEEAIHRVVAGPRKKSRLISDKEKKVIAYHESGHALAALMLPNADPVHEVSIIPRGAALGYTLQLPIEDRYLVTRSEILDKVTSVLAGRAAEEIVFDEVSSGAANDLEVATHLVRRMIMEFGMSETLGPLTFGKKEGQVFLGRDLARERDFSEEVAAEIDREERTIINECYERAKSILLENKDKLILVAETLMEKETLKGKEFEMLVRGESVDQVEPDKEPVAEEVFDGVEEGPEKARMREPKTAGGRPATVPEVR